MKAKLKRMKLVLEAIVAALLGAWLLMFIAFGFFGFIGAVARGFAG